ncbi:MAG: sugar phosphate isomerase/epimerase [Candidatus Latescibacterota bacterium]
MHPQLSLALPSLSGLGLFAALDVADGLGFRAVMGFVGGPRTSHSLGAFPTLGYDAGDPALRERVRARLACFARLSIHQSWDEEWEQWLEGAAFFGAEVLTVHARLRERDEGSSAYTRREADRLRRIGDRAGRLGMRIGVENAGGRLAEYLPLLQEIRHERVGATLDTGHCAYFAEVHGIADPEERAAALNDAIAGLVDALGQQLFHLHVHNVRGGDWRDHRSAPEGVIDFPRLCALLRRGGFAGLLDIELEEPEREAKARETGEYLSGLLGQSPGG